MSIMTISMEVEVVKGDVTAEQIRERLLYLIESENLSLEETTSEWIDIDPDTVTVDLT